MPDYSPRICIPSEEGTFVKVLDASDFDAQGIKGSNRNSAMLLSISWVSLLADSSVDPIKPNKVLSKFVRSLKTDLLGTIRSYATLNDLLCESFIGSRQGPVIIGGPHCDGLESQDVRDLIQSMHSWDELLASFKRTPIFREFLEFVRSRDPRILRFISSFLMFGKKMYYEDAALDTTALRGWIKVEDRLREYRDIPAITDGLAHIVRAILTEWKSDFFLPKHGSGSVAERKVKGITVKNEKFTIPRLMRYLLRHHSLDLINERGDSYIPKNGLATECIADSPGIARVKFVPKDINKTRTICMEPIGFQWAQQGVRLWYEDAIDRSFIGPRIPLKDQGINRAAAQYGSLTSLVDTIDLSAASDSVSWELVKSIFPPHVLKYLMGTRSTRAELPDGSIVEPLKFAPMGSALCFPVQSTVYAAVIILCGIAWRFGERDLEDLPSLKGIDIVDLYKLTFAEKLGEGDDRHLEPFYVYGDDLICDSRITSSVVRALNLLKFEVNEEKSFTGSQAYRESCGGFYLGGADVTPLRFKVKKIDDKINIESLGGVIDLANRAYDYGYMHLRRHLIAFILHYPIQGVKSRACLSGKNPVRFSQDLQDSFSIYCVRSRNTHLKRRSYDPDVPSEDTSFLWQRDEVRSITAGPMKKKKLTKKDDQYLHTLWWRSRYHAVETESNDSGMAADTLKTGTRWRWTPTAE